MVGDKQRIQASNDNLSSKLDSTQKNASDYEKAFINVKSELPELKRLNPNYPKFSQKLEHIKLIPTPDPLEVNNNFIIIN